MLLRLAITSDSNPLILMGKTRRQKRRLFKGLDYFISLPSRFVVRFSATFLVKEAKASLIPKSLSSMILQESFRGTQGGRMFLNFKLIPRTPLVTTAL